MSIEVNLVISSFASRRTYMMEAQLYQLGFEQLTANQQFVSVRNG